MFENVLYDTSVLDVEAALGLAGRSGLQGEAEVHQVAAGLHDVGRAASRVHETSLEGIAHAEFVHEPQAGTHVPTHVETLELCRLRICRTAEPIHFAHCVHIALGILLPEFHFSEEAHRSLNS